MSQTAIVERPRGRPRLPQTSYDPEIANFVCLQISCSTDGLEAICAAEREANPSFPSAWAIRNWLITNDDFAKAYARSRELQMHVMADEIIAISDNANGDACIYHDRHGHAHARIDGEAIQRSKLRTDNRKWLMARLARSVFGDSIDVTSGGEPLPAPSPLQIDARVQTIMLAAAARRDNVGLLDD